MSLLSIKSLCAYMKDLRDNQYNIFQRHIYFKTDKYDQIMKDH